MSVKTVQRITNLFNRTGSVFPAVQSHGPARKLSESEELKVLDCFFLASPGIYLDEIQQELCDKTGTWVSKSTICREAKRMGLTRKKMRRIATKRSDIARAHYMVQVENMSAGTFIWVDETGPDKRNALRKYAYSLRGVTPILQQMDRLNPRK